MADLPHTDPFLRLADVEREVGLKRTTIYRRMAEGTFPRPLDLGGGTVRWPQSLISQWKASLKESKPTFERSTMAFPCRRGRRRASQDS